MRLAKRVTFHRLTPVLYPTQQTLGFKYSMHVLLQKENVTYCRQAPVRTSCMKV